MLDKKQIATIFNAIVMNKNTEFSKLDITDKMYNNFNSFYSNFIITNPNFDYKNLESGEKSDNFIEFVLKIAQKNGINLQENMKRINSFHEFNRFIKGCTKEDTQPNIFVYKKNDTIVGMWYPNFNYGIIYENAPQNKTLMKTNIKSKKPQEFIMIQSLPDIPMSMTEHCHNHIKLFLDSVNDNNWEKTDLDLLMNQIDEESKNDDNSLGNQLIKLITDYVDKVESNSFPNDIEKGKQYDNILILSNKFHDINESNSLTHYSVGDVININSTKDFESKLPVGWLKAMESRKAMESLFSKGGTIEITITSDDTNTLTGLDVDVKIIGDSEAPYLNAIKDIKEFFNYDEESLIFHESKIFESKEDDYDYVVNIIGGIIGKDDKDKSKLLKGLFGVKKMDTNNYIFKGKHGEYYVTDKHMESGGSFDVVNKEQLSEKDFIKNKTYVIYQNGVATDAKFIGINDENFLFEINDIVKEIDQKALKGLNAKKSKVLKFNESATKLITKGDIIPGSRFQLESGTIFIIDDIIDDMVLTSLSGGAKGNYRDPFADVVDFFNEKNAVKLKDEYDDSTIENLYDEINAILTKKADISYYDKEKDILKFDIPISNLESAMLVNLLDSNGYTKYYIDTKSIYFEK